MIRIAISQAAFDTIARTLPFGSVGYENQINETRRAPDLAGPRRRRPSEGHARAGLGLVRCHFAARRNGGRVRPIAWLGLMLAARQSHGRRAPAQQERF
jgi:hypothetical protein